MYRDLGRTRFRSPSRSHPLPSAAFSLPRLICACHELQLVSNPSVHAWEGCEHRTAERVGLPAYFLQTAFPVLRSRRSKCHLLLPTDRFPSRETEEISISSEEGRSTRRFSFLLRVAWFTRRRTRECRNVRSPPRARGVAPLNACCK